MPESFKSATAPGVGGQPASGAAKKSDLYSSLWASCDELRGGMDASQYKDYVLFMLFIKYISDKYGDYDDFAPPVTIPKGASFKDMVALKGKSDIGDKINTQVIQPLIDANSRLARSDFPDFNDPNKLGEGQAMVDRLTNLIGIFENPELDFSQNRAEHDDILGDAYEYLMRHFATESGKSKGQFYTPSEVSRVMAKVIGITRPTPWPPTTAYDPTCGSGSLLLKVAAQAGKHITLEGRRESSAVRVGGCHRILAEHHHDAQQGDGAQCLLGRVGGFRGSCSESHGSVRGVVRDASAVVPGADVVLANEDTGVVRATTTNGVGEYAFASVDPGRTPCGPRSPASRRSRARASASARRTRWSLTSCCRWATSASRSSSPVRRRSSSARARHSE